MIAILAAALLAAAEGDLDRLADRTARETRDILDRTNRALDEVGRKGPAAIDEELRKIAREELKNLAKLEERISKELARLAAPERDLIQKTKALAVARDLESALLAILARLEAAEAQATSEPTKTALRDDRAAKRKIGRFFDLTPPTLALSPADGAQLADRTPTLRATYSDALSGIDHSSFKASLDEVVTAFAVGPGEASFTPPAPLSPGLHTFRAEVKDFAGNAAQTESVFRIASAGGAIGPEGGMIAVTDPSDPGFGASLSVPPGALDRSVDFFIIAPAPAPSLPPDFAAAGPAVDFGPDVTFAAPATITVPYREENLGAVPETGLRLLTFDSNLGRWVLVPASSIDTARNVLVAQISSIAGQVFEVGAPVIDPKRSQVFATPPDVLADGISPSTITIIPRTPSGQAVGPGQAVTVSLSGAGTLGPLTDLGDGKYDVALRSLTPGTAVARATVNGVALDARALVTFLQLPSSFVLSGFGSTTQAGAPSDLTISPRLGDGSSYPRFTGVVEVRLTGTRDRAGNLVYPETFLAVFTSANQGSLTLPAAVVFARSGPQEIAVRLVTKPEAAGQAQVLVTPGPPAALAKVAGDLQTGPTQAALREKLAAKVTDLFGNPVPGVSVKFRVTSGGAVFERINP